MFHRKTLTVLALIGITACLLVASIVFGSVPVAPSDVWEALTTNRHSYAQDVVRGLRVPRTALLLLIGSVLGVSGAVMQAITRNPLADPFVLGVSAGASLGITAAVYFYGATSAEEFTVMAIMGALLSGFLVIGIGQTGKGQSSPIRLVLAGMVGSVVMSTWTSIMQHTDQRTRETVRYLMVGGVGGRRLDDFPLAIALGIVGIIVCFVLSRKIAMLSMGEDIAAAAGIHPARVKISAMIIVVCMAGASVAISGPIGFVGFAVPHLLRPFARGSIEFLIITSALGGAALLLAADILGRLVLHPQELEVSIVMGILGAPFFILAAKRLAKERL